MYSPVPSSLWSLSNPKNLDISNFEFMTKLTRFTISLKPVCISMGIDIGTNVKKVSNVLFSPCKIKQRSTKDSSL